jgi:hypothetical protein
MVGSDVLYVTEGETVAVDYWFTMAVENAGKHTTFLVKDIEFCKH